MICDVSDSLGVVTHLELLPKNVTEWNRHPPMGPPYRRPPPRPPPHVEPPSGWLGSLRRDILDHVEAHVAGGWHDLVPGGTRAQLDYTGLVTFYDPTLPSLVDARQGKDRMHHRLEKNFGSRRCACSYRAVVCANAQARQWEQRRLGKYRPVLVERYADRLEYLRFLLSSNATVTFTDAAEQAFTVRAQLLVMLGPYMITVDVPQQQQQQHLSPSANVSWLAPVVRRCATTLTSRIPLGMLTPQEVRIHAVVEDTLREMCRRLALLWADFFDVEGVDEAKAAEVIEVGHGHIDELMSWLDWSLWV